MIKLAVINAIGTALAAATLYAVPSIAADPGANPAGKWVCFATGAIEATGLLTMTDVAYTFAPNGAPAGNSGTYRIDRNVITVTSGPLKGDLGFGHGYFNTSASPLALSFDAAAGRAITCNPDADL